MATSYLDTVIGVFGVIQNNVTAGGSGSQSGTTVTATSTQYTNPE